MLCDSGKAPRGGYAAGGPIGVADEAGHHVADGPRDAREPGAGAGAHGEEDGRPVERGEWRVVRGGDFCVIFGLFFYWSRSHVLLEVL